MVVPDGRTDAEKLAELLAETEGERLDFKATVDLGVREDELKLVKDLVAMSNRPDGGYLLIGVNNAGDPVAEPGTFSRVDFDGANLGRKVRKYVEGAVNVTATIHDVGDPAKEVVLIYVHGHADGLPVPFSVLGQHQPDGAARPEIVFRRGELLIREGSENVYIRHAHWGSVLARREAIVREQAQAASNALIEEFVRQLRSHELGSKRPAPLLLDMDQDAFAEAILANFEADADVQLRRFLLRAKAAVLASPSAATQALDRLAVVGTYAVLYDRVDTARATIDVLFDAYAAFPFGTEAQRRLDVVLRVYAIGSSMVRQRSWSLLPHLVQRRYPQSSEGYAYGSWIRHGQVEASRANLFPPHGGGLLVSATRELLTEHPHLRPDVPDEAVPDFGQLEETDELLNSLCQFDLIAAVMVAAEGRGDADVYPGCSAFNQSRSWPVLELMVADEAVRRAVVPASTDSQIAQAIDHVAERARNLSYQYGGAWFRPSDSVQRFIVAHTKS